MNRLDECELAYEWRVTYETRLGILCEDRAPTPEQELVARMEADAAIATLNPPRKRE